MKIPSIVVLNLFLLAICIQACKPECDIPDDPSCSNYDPCWGQQEVTADFITSVRMSEYVPERTGTVFTRWQTDTILTGNLVFFEAIGEFDSYTWKIGEDPRTFTGPESSTYFSHPEGEVEVTLIVESAINPACFPGDDGRDTITKRIYVVSYSDAAIWGVYRGSLDAVPLDTFEVSLAQDSSGDFILNHINPGCETQRQLPISLAYDAITFGRDLFFADGCNDPVGWMMLDSNRKIVQIPYSFLPIDSLDIPRKDRLFTGVKIK